MHRCFIRIAHMLTRARHLLADLDVHYTRDQHICWQIFLPPSPPFLHIQGTFRSTLQPHAHCDTYRHAPPHTTIYIHTRTGCYTLPPPPCTSTWSRVHSFTTTTIMQICIGLEKKIRWADICRFLYTCDNRDWRYTSAPHFTLTSRILCPSRTYILGKQKKNLSPTI